MSAQEADVLLRCVQVGQVNPGRLAILLGKDKGKITRFVDRLEARKLVTQKVNSRDRRYFLVKPTGKEKGRRSDWRAYSRAFARNCLRG